MSKNHSIDLIAEDGHQTLNKILDTFANHQISVHHVENRQMLEPLNGSQKVNFRIVFDATRSQLDVQKCLEELKPFVRFSSDEHLPEAPWFPESLDDVDKLGKKLDPEQEIGRDHPRFHDKEYQARRDYLAEISKSCSIRDPIPYVKYNDLEKNTWSFLYSKLRPLQKKYMCKQFEGGLTKLEKSCGFSQNKILQLQDISNHMIKETGFRLKPVHGVLDQREFLNAFAFRVFCCTQYVRHHATPEYSPEADVVHELLGHIPMLIDKDFADFSQQIGLLTLGASDESIAKIGALYWFTVEFGACKEKNSIKAYGAGIASSIGELENFGSGKVEFRKLNPQRELPLDYPKQTVQNYYHVAESFTNAQETLLEYGKSLNRPFDVVYDSQSQKVRKIKSGDCASNTKDVVRGWFTV